jgi:hypothetical protein
MMDLTVVVLQYPLLLVFGKHEEASGVESLYVTPYDAVVLGIKG